MDGKSRNLTEDYIEQIKILFPEVVTEVADKDGNNPTHKVDMEKLSILLGEAAIPTDDTEYRQKYGEKFTFDWSGKRRAIAEAQKRSTGTLRPCPEESLDWDTTENLYIEGDNLEVLKLLQDSYLGAVKMIYIDPPYNTGKDFVYKDNYKDNLSNYLEQTNTTNAVNSEASGRYHTNWLNMMYPRLKLARNLLTDDGSIFIHIDEHEVSNLQVMCSEIFGEDNELGTIIWDKRNPKGVATGVAYQHESILIYAKNKACFSNSPFSKSKENASIMLEKAKSLIDHEGEVNNTVLLNYKSWLKTQKDILSGGEIAYNLINSKGDIYQTVSMAAPDKPETRSHRPLIHPATQKPCPVPSKGWRFIDIKMDELLLSDRIEFGKDETTQPRQKYYLKENLEEAVSSLIYFGGSDDAQGLPFDNPKPVYIANRLIKSTCKDTESIVLDFFSGSGTTAEAVIQLNAEDGGNRKYICVQLPEQTPEGGEAYKFLEKLGKPTTIPEIAKERIRRAGKKILEEQNSKNDGLFAEKTPKLDVGFKVFKLDRSNVKNWDVEVEGLSEKEVQEALSLEFEKAMEILKDGRTELDLLYEVMLKLGLKLTTNVEEVEIDGKSAYLVGDGVMVASFAKNITYSHVSKILDLKPNFIQSGEFKVVFADESFASDNDKTNAMQLFKQRGITNFEII